jgi:AcrR family transcriptional regulator
MRMSDQALEFDRTRQFELRRERLLKVAAGCFNGKGFSGTSLRDIADRLNISDPAIYHYVKGKEELVFLCYERALVLIEEAVAHARAGGGTGLDRVRHYVEHHVAGLCGPSGPIAVLSEVAALSDPHQKSIRARLTTTDDEITAFITEGIADGSIRPCDPEIAARAVTGAINWIPRWYALDQGQQAETVVRTLADLLAGGLAR